MPEPILLIGAGGHARAILDAIRTQGRYRAVGWIASLPPAETVRFGLPFRGTEADLPAACAATGARGGVIAIGDNWQRRRLARQIRAVAPDFTFVIVIHAAATVAEDVCIGAGTVILPGAVAVSGCTIGEGCILNTRSSIDHESTMDAFASLGPGATVGGRTRIGACAAIGLGACVRNRVTLGAHTVIGMGAVVTDDVPAGVLAYGNPARLIRTRAEDEPYL